MDVASDPPDDSLAQQEAACRQALAEGKPGIVVLPRLARILAQRGGLDAALDTWDALLALSPRHLNALLEKGMLLRRLGRPQAALEAFTAAHELAPDDTLIRASLAVAQADAGARDAAVASFRTVLAQQPGNIHVRHQLRRLTSTMVPFWHIPMLNDARRNDAFDAAIRAAITSAGPQALVLDIGAGSGLLAMMAARAGAEAIVTCEAVKLIAETASAIVARNGHAQQVRVIAKPSAELQVGEDLPARADILISEILSSDLLAEGVLDTFEDARRRLLKPDAIIIPRAASAMGCLVESPTLADYVHVSQAAGFDVSAFNALAPQRLPVHGTMTEWRRLSPDIELLRLDLAAGRHEPVLETLRIPVLADGMAIGIVQWIMLDLADGVGFANHPDDYIDGGWLQILHSFPHPLPVRAGGVLDLVAGHDRTSLILVPAES